MNLTANQQFKALKALADDAYLSMDLDGSWFVNLPHVEIKHGSILSGFGEHKETPEGAIASCFAELTRLPIDQYVVIDSMSKDRKAFRWNDFMWEQVKED